MMNKRSAMSRQSQDAEMRALFAAFDKDNNGYIDGHELKLTMKDVGLDLTNSDVEMMMRAAGVAVKDRIFYEDFVRMMTGNMAHTIDQNVSENAGKPQMSLGYTNDDAYTQELRVAFSMFDKDGDGLISVSEAHSTLKSLGLKFDESHVKSMVERVDIDGDGSISFTEFQQLLQRYDSSRRRRRRDVSSPASSCASELDLRETFDIFDKDSDGFVNATDLKSTMKQLGLSLNENDIHDMLKSVGIGPRGRISFPDFCKMIHFNGRHKCAREIQICPRLQIGDQFTAEQKHELRAVFDIFDKDCDGFISMDEVSAVLTSMGAAPSTDHITEIFRQVDLDANNLIDFREFLLLIEKYERPLSEEREMRDMFNAIDADHNGIIDVDELKSTFTSLGLPLSNDDCEEMLREANVQGRRIFYEDFVQLMTGQIGQAQRHHLSTFPQFNTRPRCVTDSISSVDCNSVVIEDATELQELRVQFAQFDKDADGIISQRELCEVMTSLGVKMDSETVKKVLRRTGVDGDDRITFTAFCTLMRQQRQQDSAQLTRLPDQESRQVFRAFDKNHDGYIDEHELRQTMEELGMRLSADDIASMMRQAGCHITGRVYYEEFVKIMFRHMTASNSTGLSSPPVSDDILQELRVAFALVDKDGDGRITPRELMTVMNHLGFKSDDVLVRQMIARFDSDGNGTLEFGEFHDMMKATLDGTTRWEKLKKAHTPPDTWKAFKVFDRNGDGYISKTELYQTMKELGVRLSLDDLNEMMLTADINQDGRIDYAEFSKLMTGAFQSFAKQAAKLNQTRSLYDTIFDQQLTASDLQAAFEKVDVDSDGVINSSELRQIAISLGLNISQSQADAIVSRFGCREKKLITLNQFMVALSRADESATAGHVNTTSRGTHHPSSSAAAAAAVSSVGRDEMLTAFQVLDANKDGFIDASELRSAMRELTGDSLSDADVSSMITAADRDGDGRINYQEFVAMMHSK